VELVETHRFDSGWERYWRSMKAALGTAAPVAFEVGGTQRLAARGAQ
jgi:hypothetical protein